MASLICTSVGSQNPNRARGQAALGLIERLFAGNGQTHVTKIRLGSQTRRWRNGVRGVAGVALLLLSSGLACAADDDVEFRSPSSTNLAQPKSVITERLDSPDPKLGKGDWVVRGPVADSFHRGRKTENRSLGRRILGLPIIRLFVPMPTPLPSETEVYFVEGQSSRPWASIASETRRLGSPDNPLFLEGGCALVTIGR